MTCCSLTGPEPDMAWQRFARSMRRPRVAARRAAQMVALGAYPFATPHTRTVAPVVLVTVGRGGRERAVR